KGIAISLAVHLAALAGFGRLSFQEGAPEPEAPRPYLEVSFADSPSAPPITEVLEAEEGSVSGQPTDVPNGEGGAAIVDEAVASEEATVAGGAVPVQDTALIERTLEQEVGR